MLHMDEELFITEDNCIGTFDFNSYYRGYYPPCRFTAIGREDGMWYIAGTDPSGIPHVFSSDGGTVWTPVNIASRLNLIPVSAYGDILCILLDSQSRQVFLVSENGFLITIPDCPECVGVRAISSQRITGACPEGEGFVIKKCDGETTAFRFSSFVQYRCSWAFARAHSGENGTMIDLRKEVSDKGVHLPNAVYCEPEKLEEFLEQYSKNHYLFFFCGRGIKSGDAVHMARTKGYIHSFTLGGVGDLMMDQAYLKEVFHKPDPQVE